MKRAFHKLTCMGPAWLFGWVAAIFLPGAIMAATPSGTVWTIGDYLHVTWDIADEVGPIVKLTIGGLLAVGFYAAGRLSLPVIVEGLLNIVIAIAAVGLTLAFLPEGWSRGFGIGLTGARFDPSVLPVYLAGAVAAGLVFTISVRACRARQ